MRYIAILFSEIIKCYQVHCGNAVLFVHPWCQLKACVGDIVVELPSLSLALLCRRLTIRWKGFNDFLDQCWYVSFCQWFGTVTHHPIECSNCIIASQHSWILWSANLHLEDSFCTDAADVGQLKAVLFYHWASYSSSLCFDFVIALDIVSSTLYHRHSEIHHGFILNTKVFRIISKVFQYMVESTWNHIELIMQASPTPTG